MSYPECTFNDGDPPLGRYLFGAIYIEVHCLLAYRKDLASSRWVDNEWENGSKSCMAWELRLSNSDTLYIKEIEKLCFQHQYHRSHRSHQPLKIKFEALDDC
jgi:hypothetical protein